MLLADATKLFGMVFGVAFATLLIAQQSSLFYGLLLRTRSLISDAKEVNLWVMDPGVEYVDLSRPIRSIEVQKVREATGVAWAVPFFRGVTFARTHDGRIVNISLVGVDDETLIGMAPHFVQGSANDLRRPDAIAVDQVGFMKLWPHTPISIGRELEINDHRGVVTAISNASATFLSSAVIYTRYSQVFGYFPNGRDQLSFVLARSADGYSPEAVARAIEARTGLKAYTTDQFGLATMAYYFFNTGIAINFAVVIALGFIVGVAIVALTFSIFISDNVRQFATLKALGASRRWIRRLVSVQAAIVGLTGYSIGLGLTAAFVASVDYPTSELRGFYIPWWVAVGVAAETAVVMLVVVLTGLRHANSIDPAVAFRA